MCDKKFSAIALSLIKYSKYPLALPDNIDFCMPTIGEYNLVTITDCANTQKNNVEDVLNEFSRERFKNPENDVDSKHTFYAVVNENFQNSDFFNVKKSFMFITMINLNYNSVIKGKTDRKKVSNQIINILKKFNINKNEENSINFIVYDALDSFDILILFKSNTYNLGAKVIRRIDSIKYVLYSYSLFAYERELLKLEADDNDPGELADKITICGVINYEKAFNEWYEKFCSKYGAAKDREDLQIGSIYNKHFMYNRLGNEDIVINIRKHSIRKFLSLFERDELFNALSLNDAFISFRINIDNYFVKIRSRNSASHNSSDMKEKFLKAKERNKNIIIRPEIKTAIMEVLNSCDNLFRNDFASDVYICIKNVYDIFLERVGNYYVNDMGAERNRFGDFNDSVNRFKNSIMSIVTGSLHADHVFFQSPGFNAVQYNIPSKLLVFYTAFVNKLSYVLKSEQDEEFGFIITPDIYMSTYCSKLFADDSFVSLVKIRTSVDALFHPREFLEIITHETAHYIGADTRLRKERMNYSLQLAAHYYTSQLLADFSEEDFLQVKDVFSEKDIMSSVSNKKRCLRFSTIRKMLFNRICEIVLDALKESYSVLKSYRQPHLGNRFLYLHNVKKYLYFLIADINEHNEIIDRINSSISREPDSGLDILCYEQAKYFLIGKINSNLRKADRMMKKDINGMCIVMKESYADLVMTYILDLDCNSYLDSFLSPGIDRELMTEEYKAFFLSDMKIERIICVCKARGWDIQEASCMDHKDDKKECMLKVIKEFESGKIKMQTENKCIDFYVEYLKMCLDKLEKKFSRNSVNEISKIFNGVTVGNWQDGFKMIFDEVEEIKKKFIS